MNPRQKCYDSYDKTNKVPVKIFFQDTMERGSLFFYDNGIILSEGSGGAALHVFEFGKISADGLGYELVEKIYEEYTEGKDIPDYKDPDTGAILEYKSTDEIMNKYVSNAESVIIE